MPELLAALRRVVCSSCETLLMQTLSEADLLLGRWIDLPLQSLAPRPFGRWAEAVAVKVLQPEG